MTSGFKTDIFQNSCNSKVRKYECLKKSPLQPFIKFLLFFRYKDKIRSLKWAEIYSLYKEGHANVLAIIDLILTLPASSAANDPGFSEMKLTKTNTQSQMNNTTLNHFMIIQTATAKVKEFDLILQLTCGWMLASGHEDQCFTKEAQGSEQDWRSMICLERGMRSVAWCTRFNAAV